MEVKHLKRFKRKDLLLDNKLESSQKGKMELKANSNESTTGRCEAGTSENANAWSKNVLNMLQTRLNNFHDTEGSSESASVPFLVEGTRVGTILPHVLSHIQSYPDVFTVVRKEKGVVDHVTLASSIKTFDERSQRVDEVMQEFRKNDTFETLRGWRNEAFAVSRSGAFNERRYFKVERSAACLLGITQYGVHVNGYFRKSNGSLYMWIARRSSTKPTAPGKLDQIAAGGIKSRSTITETLYKECKEEASIPEYLASRALPVGAVSFIFEDDRGLFPGVQFIYDLCLPEDFKPEVNDGEVSEFYCWPLDKVKEKIATNEFKPNCALVVLDFLIRHGEINPQNEPHFLDFILLSHKPPC